MKAWFFLLCFLLELTPLLWGGKDLPQFAKLDTDFIYFNLKKEDSREVVMKKLREGGFLQIY